MKRLIKKASISLYHGTSIENCISIVKNGTMLPQGGNGAGMWNQQLQDKFNGFIFLTNDFSTAKMYAEDLYYGQKSIPSLAVIEFDIPESRLLPDDIDCEECETWQQSLEEIQQLKVEGSIDSSCFKVIHIITNGNEEILSIEKFLEKFNK